MILWRRQFHIFRPLGRFPLPSYAGCEVRSDPSYYCEGRKRHDDKALFVYTLEGYGVFRFRDREKQVPPESGFLCRSMDPDIAWYYPEGGSLPWKFVWINFQGLVALEMVQDLNDAYGHVYELPLGSMIVSRLLGLPGRQSGQASYLEFTVAEGSELFAGLTAALTLSVEQTQKESQGTRIVRRAQELIHAGIEGSAGVADIAAQMNLSREHLARLFKEETGQSPGQYLMRQRMLFACQLLKAPDLSCKEIAFRLGYKNPTNFTRAFQATLHTTPSDFRKHGAIALL